MFVLPAHETNAIGAGFVDGLAFDETRGGYIAR